jgi:hypothetical protein
MAGRNLEARRPLLQGCRRAGTVDHVTMAPLPCCRRLAASAHRGCGCQPTHSNTKTRRMSETASHPLRQTTQDGTEPKPLLDRLSQHDVRETMYRGPYQRGLLKCHDKRPGCIQQWLSVTMSIGSRLQSSGRSARMLARENGEDGSMRLVSRDPSALIGSGHRRPRLGLRSWNRDQSRRYRICRESRSLLPLCRRSDA